jgi:hypothetical protein
MVKKSVVFAAVAFGCVVASGMFASRGDANASPYFRRPLTFQVGRGDVVVCPSPTPGPKVESAAPLGSSGKIASVTGTREYLATVNCSTGLTYLVHGRPPEKPIVTPLRLASGATGETAYGVDQHGDVVGFMLFGTRERPYRWVADGEPIALDTPSDGAATAIGPSGSPIVGEAIDRLGKLQAAWFAPSPGFFIPPAGASFVNTVKPAVLPGVSLDLYAGELGGVAAAAYAPGALKKLPIGHPSTALSVNETGRIVGDLALAGKCGGDAIESGFQIQFPSGQPSLIPRVGKDCTSNALDIDDGGSIVGFSSAGPLATRRAEGYNLVGFPHGVVDLNATTGYGKPWAANGHRLLYASGIDDHGDIAATDSAGEVWFLWLFPGS